MNRTTGQEPPAGGAFATLAAPLPPGVIQWRQDGKPVQRDGKYFARFVAYIDAQFVRERLDSVVPGEWDLALELLPAMDADGDGVVTDERYAFKARLTVLGVSREDVGAGRDYKAAATDAFKRVAVRFGIGSELYSFGQNWVQVDGDSRYAKPVEDPQQAYERRQAREPQREPQREPLAQPDRRQAAPATVDDVREVFDAEPVPAPARQSQPDSTDAPGGRVAVGAVPPCPECGGKMWDNRLGKRNPKAPDFKCRDRGCTGVIWPPKPSKGKGGAAASAKSAHGMTGPDADEIPF